MIRLPLALAACLALPGISASAATVTLDEASLERGFSQGLLAPTRIALGFEAVRGIGGRGANDYLYFADLAAGAQTLVFTVAAPEGTKHSYSAGGTLLWSESPFLWGGERFQIRNKQSSQSFVIDLGAAFAGQLFVGIAYDHGHYLRWELSVPGNATASSDFEAVEPSVVPLPSTAALLATAIGGTALMRRRRRGS